MSMPLYEPRAAFTRKGVVMESILVSALVMIAKRIVGVVIWSAALEAVELMADTGMPKAERADRVRAKLREAFSGVPGRLLNLALEVAVIKLEGLGKT
jgi:hypothetical protein